MNDSPLRRVTREPALILGVVIAGLGLLVLFGIDLSKEQIAGIVTFLGAVVALLRFLLTPSSEVLAQQTPNGPVAGAASIVETGTPVTVGLTPVDRS